MRLTGYTDRWSVRPGEEISFHVHSTEPRYAARLVRLIHGDESPRGPGFREVEVDSLLDGEHPGAPREVRKGSCAVVPYPMPTSAFAIAISLWPTLPGPGRQGILSFIDAAGDPVLGLSLTADGHLEAFAGSSPVLRFPRPLKRREWVRATLVADVAAGTIALTVTPKRWAPDFTGPERIEASLPALPAAAGRLLFAAASLPATPDGPKPVEVFNGKLAQPRVGDPGGAPFAAWDFFEKAGTRAIVGVGDAPDGITVNRPARLMTGPDFPGADPGTGPTPKTHDAIHFHDDDVADAGWPESHRFRVPDGLPSGVYALRLRAGGDEDHIPFFVCPPRGGTAKLAVLMPTMSYLAYSNESLDVTGGIDTSPLQDMTLNAAAYAYVAENGLKSLYDNHRDGSGIAYASRRRPIIDFRPRSRCRTFDAPHQFAADLHLIDWLTAKGYAFDVITDDLLHDEGAALLAPYKAVVTGSHPEYWTETMLLARDAWLDAGGRFLYLGGNGFYWVTAVAEDDPDVIEVRRYTGTRTWIGEPGEDTVSLTGERGGLWRERGRAPQKRGGVGFTGQGFDRGVPFHRTEASYAPDVAWVFAGVEGAIVGAGPSLVLNHGAAGFEIDKADPLHGTPAHAVVLASTRGFTDAYQAATECFAQVHPHMGGSDPRSGIQADILLMHGPNGGAVFSAGSIIWSATLSANGYSGDTSRITANVIDAFLGGPLPGAPATS
ncbi:MAG TPA: hypothetical protein PKA74_03555 [Bauldia sp.]|nr:hypothetical protein [Bauldia sp.]